MKTRNFDQGYVRSTSYDVATQVATYTSNTGRIYRCGDMPFTVWYEWVNAMNPDVYFSNLIDTQYQWVTTYN